MPVSVLSVRPSSDASRATTMSAVTTTTTPTAGHDTAAATVSSAIARASAVREPSSRAPLNRVFPAAASFTGTTTTQRPGTRSTLGCRLAPTLGRGLAAAESRLGQKGGSSGNPRMPGAAPPAGDPPMAVVIGRARGICPGGPICRAGSVRYRRPTGDVHVTVPPPS